MYLLNLPKFKFNIPSFFINNEITSEFFKCDYILLILYVIVIQYFNSHLFLYSPNQLFYIMFRSIHIFAKLFIHYS